MDGDVSVGDDEDAVLSLSPLEVELPPSGLPLTLMRLQPLAIARRMEAVRMVGLVCMTPPIDQSFPELRDCGCVRDRYGFRATP